MKTFRYGFCFVFDPAGRVLVLKRAGHMRARPNEWDLPGGTIDEGESLEQGVAREVTEETGLVLGRLELVITRGGEWEGAVHEFSYFRADVQLGEVKLSHEHAEHEWHEPLVASAMVQFRPHLRGLTEVMKGSEIV